MTDEKNEDVTKRVKLDIKGLPKYPSNSHTANEQTPERPKKFSRVTSGDTIKRKKPLHKRFLEIFLGESESGDVIKYIIYDVIVPATKSTISEMVTGGIEMLLFGEARSPKAKRVGDKSYIFPYNSINKTRSRDERATVSRNRARSNFSEIVIESRQEAEEVLSTLVDCIEEYGFVAIADLYDLIGEAGDFTDNKWGWVNLGSASVSRVREGYLLNLPKPIPLD